MCIELLTQAINNHERIQGLQIGDYVTKVVQFADDTCLTLRYNEENLKTSLKILGDYQIASGLKLNMEKTEILKIGPISVTDGKLCPELNICWKNDSIRLLGIHICNDTLDSYKMNFEVKLDVSKTVVNIWHQRNLTLSGKSLVAKTFILSQWMYPITVLPVQGLELDKHINKILFSFLWNGKPDKIKRSVISSDVETGGLRYPNMTYYLKSTKISWIKRILSNIDLFNIACYFFKPLKTLQRNIVNCNLCKDDLHIYIKSRHFSTLYEIFYNICDINYCKWDISTNFPNEIIWLNSCIKINRKPLYNVKCIKKGILRISDLMIDSILFLTYEEFVNKYGNIINFMYFNSIISCIKMHINAARLIGSVPHPNKNVASRILKAKKPQRVAYNNICNIEYSQENPIILLCNKWQDILGLGEIVEKCDMSKHFKYIKTTTICIRLRNFVYKYYHCKLYLNPILFTIGIKDTDLCSFCNQRVENVEHLFYYCKSSKELWASLKTYLHTKFRFILDVNVRVIFPSTNLPIYVRTLIYVCLYYIYTCRVQNMSPNRISVIREFHKVENIEYEIARNCNKLSVHYNKWNKDI